MKALKSCNINTEVLLEEDYNKLSAELSTSILRVGSIPEYPVSLTTDQASTKYIMFRPSYLDLQMPSYNNIKITSLTLQTRYSGGVKYDNLYVRIKKSTTDTTYLGISEPNTWLSSGNVDVTFNFSDAVEIDSPNDMYCIEFAETPTGTALTSLGMSVYSLNYYDSFGEGQNAANNRCYFIVNDGTIYGWLRPKMSIKYFATEYAKKGEPVHDINTALIDRSSDAYSRIWQNVNVDKLLDQANIKQIAFYPRFFEMKSNDKITSITLTTRKTGAVEIANVKLRIKTSSSTDTSAVIAESNATTWPSTVNTNVTFTFATPVVLPNKDMLYFIDFADSSEVKTSFGITQHIMLSNAPSNDCYVLLKPNPNKDIDVAQIIWVPKMTVAFKSESTNDKLNTENAAPAFKFDQAYYIGEHVTFQGNLYAFTSNHTADTAWDTTEVSAVSMTSPDATFDVLSYGGLRLVNTADGALLWQQGYNLSSTSSIQLKNETVNYFEFATNATSAANLIMPARTPGKVSDFILDIKNPDLTGDAFDQTSAYSQNAVVVKDNYQWKALTAIAADTAWNAENWEQLPYPRITISNDIDLTMAAYIPSNEMLSDMFTIMPGETSELYFTQTAFTKTVDSKQLPVYKIVKQTITDGGSIA